MDLIKASELVLQELSNMTDDDLVLALEACEDNSIGYAVYGEEINLDILNESCKIITSTTFNEKEINHVSYPIKKSSST